MAMMTRSIGTTDKVKAAVVGLGWFLMIVLAESSVPPAMAQISSVAACIEKARSGIDRISGKQELIEKLNEQEISPEVDLSRERSEVLTESVECISENISEIYERVIRVQEAEKARDCVSSIHAEVIDFFKLRSRLLCERKIRPIGESPIEEDELLEEVFLRVIKQITRCLEG